MRNSFSVTIFAAIIGVLLIGCSNISSNERIKRPEYTSISPIEFETKEMRITRLWGPHSKISESNFAHDNVHVGMKFSKFESILYSQGFSKEWILHSSHYSGDNVKCKQMYGTSRYSFEKIKVIDGRILLHYIEAENCDLEETPIVKLLESEPTLEIYELTNAKNK